MKNQVLLLAIIAVLFLGSFSSACTVTWTTLDYPGASLTSVVAIDGDNMVVECSVSPYSFLSNGTTWKTQYVPGNVTGISGDNIVGTYWSFGNPNGYWYNGTSWTTLNFPGATRTEITGIDSSKIVGSADGHGVIYNLDNQTWSILDYPEAGTDWTRLTGIDGSNIVGFYQEAAYPYNRHNFLYDGTTWNKLNVPGYITGISGSSIVGNYFDISFDNYVGFLYDGATLTTLAFPGSSHTEVFGIDGYKIVGQYSASGVKHGFIATIPEPASILLFGLGILALRRRRAV
jgi:hypothetical protein